MSRKRSFADDVKPFLQETSPAKRPRRDSAFFPQTPVRSGASSSRPSKVSFTTPSTPYTPYPPKPSDSPSNPFKRKGKITSLPPITTFNKHIALRMQFVRRDVSPMQGGVYRVVQVPLIYTFTHLRALIAWLFETPARYANGKASEEQYLFEVKNKVVMFSGLYKPGQIKTSVTSGKVSNVRDPWHARYGYGVGSEDELDEEEEETEQATDAESEDWKWEDEEEYTLGHVWSMGIKPEIGIIYHHSPTTQVHITPNNTKLPRRRGRSNLPHVFRARGHVHLSPPPLPRLVFPSPGVSSSPFPEQRKGKRQMRQKSHSPPQYIVVEDDLSDTDADGDTDQGNDAIKSFNINHPFFRSLGASPRKADWRTPEIILVEDSEEEEEEDDMRQETHNLMILPDRWNEPPYAFGRYFLGFMDPSGGSYDDLDESFFEEEHAYDPFDDDDDDDDAVVEEDGYDPVKRRTYPSTPGLTYYRDASSSASSLPSSSPAYLPSSSPLKFAFSNYSSSSLPDPEEYDIILEEHYPNKKYSQTPAPPKARKHRLRIKRLEKKLESIKRADFLCQNDELEEKEGVRVDELAGRELEDADVKWTKPELKEGEIWDPFGDEVEI